MENKQNSVLKTALVLLAAVGAGLLLRRNYKKSLRTIEEEHKEAKDNLTSLGLSEKDAEEIVATEENDGVNDIAYLSYRLVTKGIDKFWIGDEYTDVKEESLKLPNVIHVKSDRNNRDVNIIFRIPNYTKPLVKVNSSKVNVDLRDELRISDYIRSINTEIAKKWADKLGVRVNRRLVGYLTIEWKNPDYDSKTEGSEEYLYDTFEIPQSVYENFADEDHDGLTAFYEDTVMRSSKTMNKVSMAELEHYLDGRGVKGTFTIVSIFLGFKVTFPQVCQEEPGVSFDDVATIVKDTIDNFEIERKTGKSFRYDHVFFHALDSNGNGCMSTVYEYVDGEVKEMDVELL